MKALSMRLTYLAYFVLYKEKSAKYILKKLFKLYFPHF